MLLSPIQVGLLAAHVQKVITDYPPVPYSEGDGTSEKTEVREKPDWEKALEAAVNADSGLPDYQSIGNADIVSYLIDYYEYDGEIDSIKLYP